MTTALTIGLMSGTSLDGVDAVLAQWSGAPVPIERAFVHLPMPAPLAAELLALNGAGEDELHRAALAANALTMLYAQAVQQLLNDSGCSAAGIRALGAHGQTVRHRPGAFDGIGYTVQLLSGALLAERTGIDVVCDFRSRDVAAGGQGAPLVPAFHAACFARTGEDVAVLNIGGIANLTLLPASGPVRGFDTGPGNMLMDLWCQQRLGLPFDAGGELAKRGRVDGPLLRRWLSDPYFRQAPPKSTGRELFNESWLGRDSAAQKLAHEDMLATLCALTAESVAAAMAEHAPATRELLVCGGGAFNDGLMQCLAAALGDRVSVASTAHLGMGPDRVEALAFAWLARAFCDRQPGSLPEVTGARGPRVLGALYPASSVAGGSN